MVVGHVDIVVAQGSRVFGTFIVVSVYEKPLVVWCFAVILKKLFSTRCRLLFLEVVVTVLSRRGRAYSSHGGGFF